jgi:serine/threonine protein kinase/Leucine-rich repeat (LRR) protein
MASSSRVETIFFAALEKKAGAERAAYLDEACGADSALRFQVERLLDAHPQAKGFLAHPAVDRKEIDGRHATEYVRSGSNSGPPDPSARTALLSTLDPERGDDVQNALKFLEPSDKPGSLGRLAHYEVLQILGNGGFGTVVKAFDEKLHRFVAIKLMSPLLAATSAPRKRFVREARSAAAVRHENVIAIYAVEDQPIPHLVMDYIAGRTLQQKLDATGPLELLDVLRIGRQIAAGLAAAHAMGLVHRDIKPGNILLEDGVEHVKITDFGLARAADDASITQSGFIAGTPMYMAPEQAQGESIDQRADLFSLGSVLYTMCSGRPPFRAANTMAVLKRVVEDTPRPIREIISETPEWLCELISRLHAKNPAERSASAQHVADLLAQRLGEVQGSRNIPSVAGVPKPDETSPPPAQEIPKPARWVRWAKFFKRPWAVAAAVLAVPVGCLALADASGVTDFHGTVIRLFSPEGVLVVEVDDPAVSVKIVGSEIVIEGAGAKEIRLQPGRYAVEATRNGKLVQQKLVTVTKNGRETVRVSREAPTDTNAPLTKVATRSADVTAWERVVAALSAAEQVKAVGARLKQLNPGFDGALVPTIEHGVVRKLEFNPDDVTDISPVRALTKLRSLECIAKGAHSALVDLSPLSGMPLTTLVLSSDQLRDLSPLKGMPLTYFACIAKQVDDLSPLRGMKLRYLKFEQGSVSDLSPLVGMPLDTLTVWAKVSDLSPLKGMKLVNLYLPAINTDDLTALSDMKTLKDLSISDTEISDLSALKGLKLTHLDVSGTRVTDLSPLKGMKLTGLVCNGTKVSDLSPLNGMPLVELILGGTKVSDASLETLKDCKDLVHLALANTQVSDAGLTHLKHLKNLKMLQLWGSKVSDLAPLENMSVELIMVTPKNISAQGVNLLRTMKSLKTIGLNPWNLWPPAEFWARYDKGEFKK